MISGVDASVGVTLDNLTNQIKGAKTTILSAISNISNISDASIADLKSNFSQSIGDLSTNTNEQLAADKNDILTNLTTQISSISSSVSNVSGSTLSNTDI